MAEAIFAPVPGDDHFRAIDERLDSYFKAYPNWRKLETTQDSDAASVPDMTRANVQEYEPLNGLMDDEEFVRVTRAIARRSLQTLADPLGAALATLPNRGVVGEDQRP